MIPETIRRRYPLFLFIVLYLLFTFFTFKDFGETLDESGVYLRGMGLHQHLVRDNFPSLVVRDPGDDGDFYDHFYAMGLNLLDPGLDLDRYHLLNLLVATVLFIVLFESLLSQTQRPWLSLSGPLFLFFTPRFTGDIPANPKDMPFALFYFLALMGIFHFSRRPKAPVLWQALSLGLLFGLAQSSRVLGFTLYPIYLLFDAHRFYHAKNRSNREWVAYFLEKTQLLTLVLIVSFFCMAVTWPYLGTKFFDHLSEILALSTSFSWNNPVLFMGQEISSHALPWTYLPVWFLVTTPLFLLAFLGLWFLKPLSVLKNDLALLMVLALGLNLVLYFGLHPVLYDGLRHYLFFLPLLAALASLSFIGLFERGNWNSGAKTLVVLAFLNLAWVGVHMVRLHPYEYVYFNELTGGLPGAQGRFETDYWGASFKEAVEWLRANEIKPDRTYKINGSGNSYQIFCYFTPNMKWVDDPQKADYYLSFTRDNKQKLAGQSPVLHVVQREGVPLNYVFDMKGSGGKKK